MGREVSFRLTDGEYQELEDLLPSVCGLEIDSPPPNCADCFQYVVRVEGEGGLLELRANDAGMAEHPAAPLVGFLQLVLDKSLAQ